MFFAEADYEGHVRGYTPNPQMAFDREIGNLNVSEAIGSGTLTVVHSHPQQKAPQRGTVSIKTGEVGEDVAYYLYQSHQVKSLVSLGVKVNSYGMVQGAAGVLIELLPGSIEATVEKLEKNFAEAGSVSEIVAGGGGVQDLVNLYLKDIPVHDLEHPHPVTYQCRCSKERLGNALTLLGHVEVETMIQEGRPAEAKCEFCGRRYTLEINELQGLLEKLRGGIVH
jgi:molecular chaperone Hsp33